MGNIILGHTTSSGVAAGLLALIVLFVIIIHIWVTGISLQKPRRIQNILDMVLVPSKWLLFRNAVSKQQFPKSKVSSFFRINGYPPETNEYKELLEHNFNIYKLKIYGLVQSQLELLLSESPCNG